ncbi:uncharacterized protein LOC122650972 [Telopea speciosissima]|uniref:uncharacterized protein LOC122650972 n=1 Tax=Telopea speciosissima TaxID=54955 RepID=UPI001CC4170E|nr:uncharacterized protein LOC122650972 [Telopea speciosissima]
MPKSNASEVQELTHLNRKSRVPTSESICNSGSFSNSSFFDDDEFEAAEILLQLPQLIAQEKYGFGSSFSFSWGAKRRRSTAESNPLPPHLPSSPPLLSNSYNSSKSSLKVKSSSPVTPLSFSPNESDSKPVMVYNRKKMTKQEMLEIIQHLGENARILKQVNL